MAGVPQLQLLSTLALLALSGCGAGSASSSNNHGELGKAGLAGLSLTSDAIQNGQPIPARYTCDGGDHVPALHWGEAPAGTRSFALVLDDPDAPRGTFRHWGVFDIPASARMIGGGQKVGTEVDNDFGKGGYSGPCPPKGNGPHHYHFKLFALDVERLALSPKSKPADVERAAEGHAIAQGELVGSYERR